MRGEVISYIEMCQREGVSLQRGMNFRLGRNYSVILMSVRKNSPYRDEVREDGKILIYEGHDVPARKGEVDPKSLDQPEYESNGALTQNGKFHRAAQIYKSGKGNPEIVQVYEKIKNGIWVDNGFFHLIDSWIEHDGTRDVFKFKLISVNDKREKFSYLEKYDENRTRIIPSDIKLQVWKRDGGKCAVCGATDELHFDHVIPFSRGGTSLRAENIQLLCARHNLQKGKNIG
jgi:hypothetical protein